MSDPMYGGQPNYVPPSPTYQQRRSGPGCWVYGLLSCLVVVVIAAALIGWVVYKAAKSPGGAKLFGSMRSAFSHAEQMAPTMANMKAVHDAVVRYHERNGVYPPTLSALVPDYIQSPSLLHAPLDANTDPSHVSFGYKRPAANAPGTTPLLTFHWSYTIDAGVQKQTVDMKQTMLINGQTTTDQTQTVSMSSTTPGGAPSRTMVVHTSTDAGGHVTTSTSESH